MMIKPIQRRAFALALILIQTGCATVVSGKHQDLMIRSEPQGASIKIDGATSGITPMVASLIRKKRHTFEISKEGYATEMRVTTRGFNWWYLGNLILGGVIGLIVDPITGAMFDVEPEAINVTLQKA